MNLNYEFWVKYYNELRTAGRLTEDTLRANNRALTGHTWSADGGAEIPMQEQALYFKVCYPGLLAGLGNAHTLGKGMKPDDGGDIGLGFSLDYVTGLPYLMSSSVKGVLRSAFLQNRAYVGELLHELGCDLTPAQIFALEADIFGHLHSCCDIEDAAGKRLLEDAAAGTDVFLDAFPVIPGAHGKLLGIENITPHRATDEAFDGLESPKPLTLLKVLPEVVFQFRFRLKDTVLTQTNSDGTTQKTDVKAETKLQLFSAILIDAGAGAKTNVGFGLLQKYDNQSGEPYRYLQLQPATAANTPTGGNNHGNTQRQQTAQRGGNGGHGNRAQSRNRNENPVEVIGDPFQAKITGVQSYGLFIKEGMVHVTEVADGRVNGLEERYQIGDTITVVEITSNKPGKRAFSMKRVPK